MEIQQSMSPPSSTLPACSRQTVRCVEAASLIFRQASDGSLTVVQSLSLPFGHDSSQDVTITGHSCLSESRLLNAVRKIETFHVVRPRQSASKIWWGTMRSFNNGSTMSKGNFQVRISVDPLGAHSATMPIPSRGKFCADVFPSLAKERWFMFLSRN